MEHRRQAGDGDYVRFALHYARALFELVRTTRSPRDLPAIVEAISSAGVMRESDIFAIADITGSLCRAIDAARSFFGSAAIGKVTRNAKVIHDRRTPDDALVCAAPAPRPLVQYRGHSEEGDGNPWARSWPFGMW